MKTRLRLYALYVRAKSEWEAETDRTVAETDALRGTLWKWQAHYSDLKAEYGTSPAPALIILKNAQVPVSLATPWVNFLCAGVAGLVLAFELPGREQHSHGLESVNELPVPAAKSRGDSVTPGQVRQAALIRVAQRNEGD